jgi:hypothetical protein
MPLPCRIAGSVGRHVREDLGRSARPVHFEPFHGIGPVEPEVDTRVALRQIARAGLDLAHERPRSDLGDDTGADAIRGTGPCDELDEQRVSRVAAVVAQEIDAIAVVRDEQVEVAIVVEVRGGEAPADFVWRVSLRRKGPGRKNGARPRCASGGSAARVSTRNSAVLSMTWPFTMAMSSFVSFS